jgi:hypothetical protein
MVYPMKICKFVYFLVAASRGRPVGWRKMAENSNTSIRSKGINTKFSKVVFGLNEMWIFIIHAIVLIK